MPGVPHPSKRRKLSCCVRMSKPAMVAVPDVGSVSPERIFSVVDLPAPLMPRKPKHWPTGMANASDFTATLPPGYSLCKFCEGEPTRIEHENWSSPQHQHVLCDTP